MPAAKSSQFDWTGERIATLKKLNADGLSASQIANSLGAPGDRPSRSAVIGKLYRLGLKNTGAGRGNSPRTQQAQINHPVRQAARENPRPPRGPTPTYTGAQPFKRHLVEVPADAEPVRLLDLRSRQCRWPLGEPPCPEATLFCGAPTEGVYCSCHNRIAYRPNTEKERKSASELARALRRYA